MPEVARWSVDELLIALDLYLNHPETRSNKAHPMLVEASEAMRALPLHLDIRDPEKYRSAKSVYARLQNYKAVDDSYDGTGLPDGGPDRLRSLLERYVVQPQTLAGVVSAIKKQGRVLGELGVSVDPDDDEGVAEGAVLITAHRRRERRAGPKKRAAVIAQTGKLECEACGFDFFECYGEIGQGFAECHHLRPLTEGPRTTKPEDLANRLLELPSDDPQAVASTWHRRSSSSPGIAASPMRGRFVPFLTPTERRTHDV